MEHSFWHDRWAAGQLGFHEPQPNALLIQHFDALALPPDSRVFVPLCGKSNDIGWLLSRGHRVAGAELSQRAIDDLFSTLGVSPDITQGGPLIRYSAPGIDIFVGDIFELDGETLGPVDAVYDRAALVALPDDMRARYAAHMPQLTGSAPQLLITFDYDQSQIDGPPFSVTRAMVQDLYGTTYQIAQRDSFDLTGGLKGTVPAQEIVLHLTPSA